MRKAAAFLTLANARRWRAYSYLVSNACVLYGNAYQAASPALTSYGAESRPCSSPPTTLKLAFLYGNAFLQPLISAANSSSVTLVSSTVTLTSCEPGSHSLWRREPTSLHPTHHPKYRCYRYGGNAAPYTPVLLGIFPKPLFS